MAVCANSIIHYTSTFDNLISILKNGFYPHYCRETIIEDRFEEEDILVDFYVPMVCFCDIPFTQVKKHSATYGIFAVGLRKEWARKTDINPVLYLCKETSRLQILIKQLMHNLASLSHLGTSSEFSLFFSIREQVETLLTMIKNERGHFYKNNHCEKNVSLYEEREWRYVPPYIITGEEAYRCKIVQKENESFIISEISRYNKVLKQEMHRLKFGIDDISYIIVESEEYIDRLIKELKDIFKESPQSKIERLLTRINTFDRIESDF